MTCYVHRLRQDFGIEVFVIFHVFISVSGSVSSALIFGGRKKTATAYY